MVVSLSLSGNALHARVVECVRFDLVIKAC